MSDPVEQDALDRRVLDLANVSKSFGGVRALKGVDFTVRAGEIHCLAGENGSGKSTLIKLVSGVHAPDPGGRILMNGTAYERLTPPQARREGIQVIFQDLALFPNLSVAENIAFDHVLDGYASPVPLRRMRRTARAILDRLGFGIDLDAEVGRLSIAQRQIVAICRGLAADARLLFMDEPTASLTGREVDALLGLVERLRRDGLSIVFVSHRLDEVLGIADRVTVLRDGACVGVYPTQGMSGRRLAELMTGLTIEPGIVARAVPDDPVLRVAGLTRRGEYEDIAFMLRKGEVFGIVGPLGAGRTELALTLFGMNRPHAGTIEIAGRLVRFSDNRAAIAAGIAYLPEDRLTQGLNLPQPVGDNIVLSILDRLKRAFGFIPPKARRGIPAAWVERLKIKVPSLDHPVQTLSGGNQQRVVLAKWLATAPRVLILDSPTVGVDIGNKKGIYELIREIARDGVAVILITDEASEAFSTCDRVARMDGGRMIEQVVPGEISEEEFAGRVYAR
ncbi:MAG: sugar ABC transporter ATP-binding protein [Rhizobiales bacterium]|nr:sugar ABC transporter ATP-binding protein [Hyphomicrobiales bacterium]